MGNITQGKLGARLRNTVKGLLPCPLCGGEVTLWNYEFGTVKVFECKACRTRFIFPWDKDVSEWNKRVSVGNSAGRI